MATEEKPESGENVELSDDVLEDVAGGVLDTNNNNNNNNKASSALA